MDNGKSKAGRTLLRKGLEISRRKGPHTRINKGARQRSSFDKSAGGALVGTIIFDVSGEDVKMAQG